MVQSGILHLVPHAGGGLPDALGAQGLRLRCAGEHVAQPAAHPAVHRVPDPQHRHYAGAGGGRPHGAGIRRADHHRVGGVHHRVELSALCGAGAGDDRAAGAAVYALAGAAASAAGGAARRGQLAGGMAGAEHGLFLLCGACGTIFRAVRLHRHGDRGAAVAIHVGADTGAGRGVLRRPH